MDSQVTKIAATLLEAVPAVAGMLVWKKSNKRLRLFTIFLTYAFLTDVFCWNFYAAYPAAGRFVLALYSLTESCFFLYFIYLTGLAGPAQLLLKRVLQLMPLVFLVCYFSWQSPYVLEVPYAGIHSIIYLVMASVFVTYAILRFIETDEQSQPSPDFYMLTGIFIYCFCSFFSDAFIGSAFKNNIWWVHDAANMIAYVIFTYGLLVTGKQAAG